MKKILKIIRQELIITFSRPSFLVVAVGIPLLGVLILAGVKVIQDRSGDADPTSDSSAEEWQMEIEGYIDQADLIQVIPPDLPEGHLIAYENEDQAKEALAAGEISAYYIIPVDFVEEGEVIYVFPDSKPLIEDGQKWVIRWTLLVKSSGRGSGKSRANLESGWGVGRAGYLILGGDRKPGCQRSVLPSRIRLPIQ